MDWIVAYGLRWHERKSGYFGNSRHGLLHRYVYEHEIGPISDGYHVHHRDENKANNSPDNLVALTPAEHFAEHPRGADWHAAGGHAAAARRPTVERTCAECGVAFPTRNPQARFCSPEHGQRYYQRTQSGRAYEERVCCVCARPFQARVRLPTRTCSRPCTAVLAYRNRRPAV